MIHQYTFKRLTGGTWNLKFIPSQETEKNFLIILEYMPELSEKIPYIRIQFPNETTMAYYIIKEINPDEVSLLQENDLADEHEFLHFENYKTLSLHIFKRHKLSVPDLNFIDDAIKKHLSSDFYQYERWAYQLRD